MEALRTQLDDLQWEVNRLEAENQRLKASDEEVGLRVDLEAEVEQTKHDAEVSTTELETSKRRLKEVKQDVIDAEFTSVKCRAVWLRELQQRLEVLERRKAELLREAEVIASSATELRQYRRLEEERSKREGGREGRLIEQIELIKATYK